MSTSTPDGFTEPVMSWADDMKIVPKRVARARRVGERLARRIRTPRGHALGHPNDGIDISDALESTLDQRGAANLRATINGEVMKDPSVKSAFVKVTLASSGEALKIEIRAFGDFGVTTVTLQQLSDGTYATTIT